MSEVWVTSYTSYTSYTTPQLSQVVGPLPPLDFLRTNMSGARTVLHQVEALTSLRHLELED
ncbi:hypothetical protein GCM10017774_90570 [Lentzea cavernae]|uniref:Uncharacterized protein n=1 Tax=Lentzea cavernae TaxID=2020703 RepID=A0ABQ3MVA2_9PSEU|nr:hypothetical protein GCM10017774_90570 [Lentzea cavernae]